MAVSGSSVGEKMENHWNGNLWYAYGTAMTSIQQGKYVHVVGKLLPKKIVYISCSPDTLARDCVELTKLEYVMSAVQPFNMFVRTEHVESVVCLTRNT